LINNSFDYFTNMILTEPTYAVKQTAAYTLMKMSEFCH
jgi:hypothetical protein